MKKIFLPLIILALFFLGSCEKRWYMESGQRKRFHKIDSMKALHEEWEAIYTARPRKYDSLRPLIDRNFRNWELAILETEIKGWELLGL